MSNEKKNQTLGMNHGTATHRLRKMILFSLLIRLKENNCFKCGKVIDAIEELSIEHKLPWEGRDAKLFWDLDNIAFSHLKCNRPHVNSGGPAPKTGPAGTSWCILCQKFESVDDFYPCSRSWNGLRPHCKFSRYAEHNRAGKMPTK